MRADPDWETHALFPLSGREYAVGSTVDRVGEGVESSRDGPDDGRSRAQTAQHREVLVQASGQQQHIGLGIVGYVVGCDATDDRHPEARRRLLGALRRMVSEPACACGHEDSRRWPMPRDGVEDRREVPACR